MGKDGDGEVMHREAGDVGDCDVLDSACGAGSDGFGACAGAVVVAIRSGAGAVCGDLPALCAYDKRLAMKGGW